MTTTWILIANTNHARLYTAIKAKLLQGNGALKLMQEYDHPESKKRDSELVSDKAGRYHKLAKTGSESAFTEMTDPKELEIEQFAKQLAEELERGRVNNEYGELIIAAAPHFQGILKNNCNPHVLAKVDKYIDKDYMAFEGKELLAQLAKHL